LEDKQYKVTQQLISEFCSRNCDHYSQAVQLHTQCTV